MPRLKDISPGEFEIMDILWDIGEGTVRQVMSRLPKERDLAHSTVAVVLRRLLDKGYITAFERSFAYVYRPVFSRQDVVEQKLEAFIDQVLHGNTAIIGDYIAKNRELTPEQLTAIREIFSAGD